LDWIFFVVNDEVIENKNHSTSSAASKTTLCETVPFYSSCVGSSLKNVGGLIF
jgi:hypothetical protein